MRLFAALELPPAARERLARRIAERRAQFPPASWVRPERFHLTLVFFGEVEEGHIASLSAGLRATAAAIPALAARIEGAGAYPQSGPVRVVWLGVEPALPLGGLAAALRSAAGALGVAFDAKPFASHVTLARCRRPWPAPTRDRLAELAPEGALAFEADAAFLLASELGAGGARYRRLERLPLAGTA